MLKGWKIVLLVAIVSAAMLGLIWQLEGFTEASTRMAIRATARMSCLLFLAAFVAAPLQRHWKSNRSSWLLQNRRFFGLSMAMSHAFHGLAIYGLHVVTQGQHPTINSLAVLGYVFLGLMVATSFRSTAKAIGRRAWRILHTAGMYYFWLAFVLEFAMRALENWIYFTLTLLVLLVMVIRVWPQRRLPKIVDN